MADIKSPEKRSQNMAAIKGKDTEPEKYLRSQLFHAGYRFRKNVGNITGHPDIWMKKYNTVIFVHGCFWHRHSGCRYAYTPKSRIEFWTDKFNSNVRRDNEVTTKLQEEGYKTLVVWECTLKKMKHDSELKQRIMQEIAEYLNSSELYKEL